MSERIACRITDMPITCEVRLIGFFEKIHSVARQPKELSRFLRDRPGGSHTTRRVPRLVQGIVIRRDVVTDCGSNAFRYYYPIVIRSFSDSKTAQVFNRIRVSKWGKDIQRQALRKLLLLEAAENVEDLRVPPGNKLERLKGNRKGQYSIRINDQWRICFKWSNGNATDVEIVDYHKG
jgi:proteic killer suppression protein